MAVKSVCFLQLMSVVVSFAPLPNAGEKRLVANVQRLRLFHPLRTSVARASDVSDWVRNTLKEQVRESAAKFKQAQETLWAAEAASGVKQSRAPLQAESFANVEVTDSAGDTDSAAEVNRLRNETVALIQQLSKYNPTHMPFDGWRESKNYPGTKFDGRWKLLFTTGADATFRPTEKSGTAQTYQEIDGEKGYFVNCVDFDKEDAKLKGFRVVVKGKRISDTEVQLYFRRVKLLRRSRWLKTLVIPLPPSWFLRALARFGSRGKAKLSDRGAGFTMLYLDDDMRMHRTFDGQYFVQERF